MLDIFSFSSINISAPALWGILGIVFGIFLIVASVLHYHWKYYGIVNNPRIFAKTMFWVVSIFLLVIMLGAVTYLGTTI